MWYKDIYKYMSGLIKVHIDVVQGHIQIQLELNLLIQLFSLPQVNNL
jgi:hypothetical protein